MDLKNAVAEVLANGDFISRTIGMNTSYDDIMFIVQMLGREPVSLLGKDYVFIFDHARRNFQQGTSVPSMMYNGGTYGCPKFTFYKEVPTVRFADPYQDPLTLLARWEPDMEFETTATFTQGGGTSIHYSESNDGKTNDKNIGFKSGLDSANPGTQTNTIYTYGPDVKTCDLIRKTNDNFNHGKYKTLIARFHTNSEDSMDVKNPTQTAFTKKYGMSHGRNLLKITPDTPNGYNNPYCRVWTYHHQYNQIERMIRPFGFGNTFSAEGLESAEFGSEYGKGGFRTIGDDNFGGGSSRLDKYGVLNYENGFVNIAPTAKIKDYFDDKTDNTKTIATKKCMFSIENLAWRQSDNNFREYDSDGLSPEQKGPLGGRIMWFPPYDLTFNEDVSVNWNNNQFIGRGEGIYTYTNTERRGNLSFTLLIDHPSIIDYWTGRDENGMKNQGKQLLKGNDGGVDEINNQENTLLRFFAGCDVLSAKPQDYYHKVEPPSDEKEKEKKVAVTNSDETRNGKPKKIQAVLFYPNNYSGVDDRNGIVNPIYYLMNGIGTQKVVGNITKKSDDLGTDIEHKVKVSGMSGDFGGYEVQSSNGVSIVTDTLNLNYNTIKKTFADTNNSSTCGQYLSKANGDKVYAWYDDGTPSESWNRGYSGLAKIVDETASSLSAADKRNLNYTWLFKRYYYRVDKDYEKQRFSHSESYLDIGSEQLNSSGFNKARKELEIEEDSENFKLVSFCDLFAALESNNKVIPITPQSREIKEILTNNERYNVKYLVFQGHASKQGYGKGNINKAKKEDYGDENEKLATNRAETLKSWIYKFKEFDGVAFDSLSPKPQTENPTVDIGENSALGVKIWRSASVIIEYEEKSDSSAANETSNASENSVITNIQNKDESSRTLQQRLLGIMTNTEGENGKTVLENVTKSANDVVNKINNTNSETNDKKLNGAPTIEQKTVDRYDNEGEFFKVLERDEPFLHHLISDKIKYFDPAFHSISPEGFNARLTFLHQCTRQGSTIEHGNPNEVSAYNLSFGRPPVCVLRVGDFYNTKIIINSLNIQYESPQWDMNPEGIGMMPMFAKVSINFIFLGGSDLAGPIARLQNAVSFNYYANTSVYDNRADMVEYEDNGSGNVKNFKGFVYPTRFKGSGEVNEMQGEIIDE